MISKYFLIVLVVTTVFSCKKDVASSNEKYVVSASKMISFTGSNWNDAELQVKNKVGYQYIAAQPGASNNVKADVYLPAIDDSSRIEDGTVYLNIAPDNTVVYTEYYTAPLSQSVAFAMMLNYNSESLKKLTGIFSSVGDITENNIGSNPSVAVVVSRLKSGQAADMLAINYGILPRGTRFAMVLTKQTDGRYIFSYRGMW